MTVPDLGAFTLAEKTALLTAMKAEVLRRVTGAIASGSSTGESFTVSKMDDPTLAAWIDQLTLDLGYPQPCVRVAPNFGGRGAPWPDS